MNGMKQFSRAATAAGLLFAALALSVSRARAQQPDQQPGPQRQVLVQNIVVQGNKRQPSDFVEAESGIRKGQRISYVDIQNAIHRLWRTGQYSDVKVYAEPASDQPDAPVTLVLDVTERQFVAFIDFEGLQHVRAKTVRDTVGLKSGAPFNPARVARAEAMVRDLLADKGIRLRKIDYALEKVPEDSTEYRLVFHVDEGERVAVAQIDFEGNKVFDAARLRDVMNTKQEGFFWFQNGTFDQAKLREDVRKTLPDFYGENGYLDFVAKKDTLEVDPTTGKARLVVQVNEGQQYHLVGLDIRGNRHFSTDQLKSYFLTSRGGLLGKIGIGRSSGQVASQNPVFDLMNFNQATDDIQQLYRNSGYLYAQVNPFMERTKTADGEPAVRVGWEIQEGEPAFVNRVDIEGNTFTHEDVIRNRIFLLPGDVYSEDRLIQSYRSIMGLGFFETPMPLPDIQPTDNGDVNVTFKVKEKQTGSINFGTSVGGLGGLTGFLGYDQPNLFGQAKSGHLRFEFGRYTNNFEASYTDPSIKGSRVSGSLSLFSSKYNRFFQFNQGEQRQTGASLTFGLPFPMDPQFTRFSVGYSLSRTDYHAFPGVDVTSIFSLPSATQSMITLTLARDNTDSPLFPTVGSNTKLEADLVGGPLGGDGPFQKYIATGSWWVPMGSFGKGQPGVRPVRLTLGLTGEFGAIVGNASAFPFQSFWMGGVQFGRPLRGYKETTITPFGYFPGNSSSISLSQRFGNAYVRLSAEYAVRFGDNVSVYLFGDAGNLYRNVQEVDPTRLFRGAGLGITLVTPFGPLGLDYAYGFDKDTPGWELHFRFGPGI